MLIDSQKELFEWKKKCPGFVSDGIVNEQSYMKSPIKLLFLLKEVNGGSDWDLCEYVANGGRKQTWSNIARWTEGIHNIDREIPWMPEKNTGKST